mgnify:CR=1 FL=1
MPPTWLAVLPGKVPAAWVDGRRLFQLAESSHKAAREVALTLIRRLYEHVGGADLLRHAMGKKDPAEMAKQRDSFMEGSEKNGFDPKISASICPAPSASLAVTIGVCR